MANDRVYNVCIPREYEHQGQTRTHFWIVGTAFPLPNKDGFSVKLYSDLLLTKGELVLLRKQGQFQVDPNHERAKAQGAPPPDDDESIPF